VLVVRHGHDQPSGTPLRPANAATVQAAVPTVAVLVEQYAPGWTALVDGKPAPILRANLLLRAVPLSAGSHRIELDYQTPGLRLAIFLSVVGLLAMVGVLAMAHRGARLGRSSTT